MKKFLLISNFLFAYIITVYSQDTFSIAAFDPNTGEVGSAGASCIGNSRIISDVHPGVGVIHTQASYISQNQNYARTLMNLGYTSQQIIDSVVANDFQLNPSVRQYGVVEIANGSAAYTGVNCLDWKGDLTGPTYSIQGNILLGPQIIDSMEAQFLRTQGSLSCRLMAALEGAKVPGADQRCLPYGISTLSAFLRVAKPTDSLTHLSLDLNVPSVPITRVIDPIDSLFKIYKGTSAYAECTVTGTSFYNQAVKRASVYPSPATDLLSVKSVVPIEKIIIANALGNTEKIITENGATKMQLNISSLSKGIIFLQLIYDGGYSERIQFLHL
ncbi:MAG: DUF1028 domain-containing protein [Chitinophagales bacterium]|nr:DUF1028 domain-containing protein [Chitinophagales bacterium]